MMALRKNKRVGRKLMRTLALVSLRMGMAPVTSVMSSLHICIAVATTGDTCRLRE